MVDERLSTSDKGSEQALHMCERELQYVKNRWEMDVLYLLLRFPSKTMVLNDSYQLRIFFQQSEAYCVSLIQYNLDHPISQQNTARRHISLSCFKSPKFDGQRKIWILLFCRAVEWPFSHDGFHHWSRYWAADGPEHPASDWTWLKTCRIPTFGHQRILLAIADSFSLDYSSQHLGWEPTRLGTTFGPRFKP